MRLPAPSPRAASRRALASAAWSRQCQRYPRWLAGRAERTPGRRKPKQAGTPQRKHVCSWGTRLRYPDFKPAADGPSLAGAGHVWPLRFLWRGTGLNVNKSRGSDAPVICSIPSNQAAGRRLSRAYVCRTRFATPKTAFSLSRPTASMMSDAVFMHSHCHMKKNCAIPLLALRKLFAHVYSRHKPTTTGQQMTPEQHKARQAQFAKIATETEVCSDDLFSLTSNPAHDDEERTVTLYWEYQYESRRNYTAYLIGVTLGGDRSGPLETFDNDQAYELLGGANLARIVDFKQGQIDERGVAA